MLLQVPKKGKAKYNPLWEGHHINSKEKLYITIRKDHSELLVLYEANKMILSQRLDQCGVHYQYYNIMGILVAAPMSVSYPHQAGVF